MKTACMDRYLILFVCLFLLTGTFWGCEQNVTVDLEEYEPKVVVHSLITQDSIPRVVLTKSRSYFSGNDAQNDYQTLADALVVISNNGQRDTLSQKTTDESFNPYNTGQFSGEEQQGNNDSVSFHYFQGHRKVEVGQTYRLTVVHKGQTVKGETTVPQTVGIDSAAYEKSVVEQFNFSDTGRTIKAYVTDPAGTENAYRLSVTFFADVPSGNLQLAELASQSITFDEALDGKQLPVEMELPTIQPEDFSNNFPDTAIAEVRVEHLTTEAGRYLRSLNEQSASGNSPFSEPVIIKSNVDNGLGVFGSYALSESYRIKVPLRN